MPATKIQSIMEYDQSLPDEGPSLGALAQTLQGAETATSKEPTPEEFVPFELQNPKMLKNIGASELLEAPRGLSAMVPPNQTKKMDPTLSSTPPKTSLGENRSNSLGGFSRRLRGTTSAAETLHAPPNFPVGEKNAIFVDIQKVQATLEFDLKAKQARVRAKVDFEQGQEGYPIIDLVPNVQSIKLDGKETSLSHYVTAIDPDGQSNVRVLQRTTAPGKHHLELSYSLPRSKTLRFLEQEVNFLQRYGDLLPRGFVEQYLPSNYEYDRYPMSYEIRITGTDRPHRIMSNGEVLDLGKGRFEVHFPQHFNAPSFFMHIIDPTRYVILEEEYPGRRASIPMTVYVPKGNFRDAEGSEQEEISAKELALRAMTESKELMRELEATYGPYAHPAWLVHVDGLGKGGMEYAGAAEAKLATLGHEQLHSFNARSLGPVNGNAGWIDEAWTTWHDRGYPRADGVKLDGPFPQLSGLSPYMRHTLRSSYEHGSDVLSEIDYIMRDQGGLRPVLSEFYQTYVGELVDTETFLNFLNERSPEPLDEIFRVKIYGQPRNEAPNQIRNASS